MALRAVDNAVDEQHESGAAVPSRSRPIDLVHLCRQTLGDGDLEREVLSMFLRQALSVRARIENAPAKERWQMAHGLVGAARGVGAFPLADCACAVEADPADPAPVRRLCVLIEEVRDFVSGMEG